MGALLRYYIIRFHKNAMFCSPRACSNCGYDFDDPAHFSFHFVQDTLLKGRFSLNVPDRRIGYRKQIALPNGSKVALVGSCTYMNGHVKPNFGIQFKFGANVPRVAGHTDAVWHGNSFGIRQKINVVSGLGLEVCGAMSFPEPTARYTYDGGSLVVGEGAFQLHVEEVNGVLKLGYD